MVPAEALVDFFPTIPVAEPFLNPLGTILLEARQHSSQVAVSVCKGVIRPTAERAISLAVRMGIITIVNTVSTPLSGPLINYVAYNRIYIQIIAAEPSLGR